jgi:RHS repeat-associated protein
MTGTRTTVFSGRYYLTCQTILLIAGCASLQAQGPGAGSFTLPNLTGFATRTNATVYPDLGQIGSGATSDQTGALSSQANVTYAGRSSASASTTLATGTLQGTASCFLGNTANLTDGCSIINEFVDELYFTAPLTTPAITFIGNVVYADISKPGDTLNSEFFVTSLTGSSSSGGQVFNGTAGWNNLSHQELLVLTAANSSVRVFAGIIAWSPGVTGSYLITVGLGQLPDGVACRSASGVFPGCDAPPPDMKKTQGNPSPCQGELINPGRVACGRPIDVATGNMFEDVTDYATLGPNKLAFVRSYNSQSRSSNMLGRNWRSNYDRTLNIASATSVTTERADGQGITFTLKGGAWQADTDVDLQLSQTGSGIGSTWTLIAPTDATETYTTITATQAQLTSIRARNGYTQTLDYNGSQPDSVTDSFGRSLLFSYQNDLLQTLTTPDGLVLTYSYDSSGAVPGVNDRLVSISYSTTPVTSQTYLYGNASFPFALTGLEDENGNLFTSWTYDSLGRATSSQLAGGAELTQVAYNVDGTRTVTDPLGAQTVYTFATLQGVPKVTQMSRLATATTAAATRNFTYDVNGYKASETDWNGDLTTYVNDARGLPTSITEASGTPQARTTTVAYDAIFHVPTKSVEPGLTTEFIYDGSGNVLTKTLTDTTSTGVPYSTNGTKRAWTFAWGAFGLLASSTGPRTDLIQLTSYSYNGDDLGGVVNALNQQTLIPNHLPGGLPQTILDPSGAIRQFNYDTRLRLTDSAVFGQGSFFTQYFYDAAGNLTQTILPDGSALTSAYDPAHRVIAITDNFGQKIAYTLDAMGDRTAINVRDPGNTTKWTHSATFDSLGRLIQDTSGAGQTTKYTYDPNGNALAITDPLNRITTQSFDALNRRVKVTDPLNGVTTATYDAHNRPLTVTAPNGAVTSYVYDGFGDLIQETSPDRGTTVYQYDLAGNLTQVTDARNIVQNNAYDALDRKISTTYPGGASENVAYRYDESGHGFGVGRLTSVIDEAGTLSRSYDARGNILSETRTHGAATLVTSYTYDAASRTASIKYPSGATAAYSRDTMGRVIGVTMKPSGAGSAMPVLSNIAYQPFGPVSGLTFGNGISGTRSFDLDYRLTNLTDGNVQNLTYGYNAADDVLSIADGANSASSQNFVYDALDRLTSAGGIYGSLGWSYDANGNRLTQTAGGTTTNYVYMAQTNKLTQVKAGSATQVLSYTPSGNITTIANVPSTRPATGIAYNQAGRLQRVLAGGAQTLSYNYDAFGHRLVKTGSAVTLYQYDPASHLLEEANGSGATVTDYIYLGDRPIATLTPGNSSLAFIHADRLGTPQKATNSGQSVVWKADYLPFGDLNAATSQTATLAQSLRLPGQEFEAETGWHQNGFRDYVPSLGRYLESDPIGLEGGPNSYRYASNTPLRLIDRYGLLDPDTVEIQSRITQAKVVPQLMSELPGDANAASQASPYNGAGEFEDKAERGDVSGDSQLGYLQNNSSQLFDAQVLKVLQFLGNTCTAIAAARFPAVAEVYDAYSNVKNAAAEAPSSNANSNSNPISTPQTNSAVCGPNTGACVAKAGLIDGHQY